LIFIVDERGVCSKRAACDGELNRETSMASTLNTRDLVVAFYNGIAQRDYATVRRLGRQDYIQHNPDFETGLCAVFKQGRHRRRPERSSSFGSWWTVTSS
jgi:hypothetical protein